MDINQVIYELGTAVLNAAEVAADEGKRSVNMGSLGAVSKSTGKDKLIKFTIVAEPPVFSETLYPDKETHSKIAKGEGAKPIETTSVIEQLKMLDECNENSIRH